MAEKKREVRGEWGFTTSSKPFLRSACWDNYAQKFRQEFLSGFKPPP